MACRIARHQGFGLFLRCPSVSSLSAHSNLRATPRDGTVGSAAPCSCALRLHVRSLTEIDPVSKWRGAEGRACRDQHLARAFEGRAGAGSNCPADGQRLRLLQHGAGHQFLLVRRVAVLAQDAPYQSAEMGAHVFAKDPVRGSSTISPILISGRRSNRLRKASVAPWDIQPRRAASIRQIDPPHRVRPCTSRRRRDPLRGGPGGGRRRRGWWCR